MFEQIFADIRFLPHRGTMPSTPRKTSFLGEEPSYLGVGHCPLLWHVLNGVDHGSFCFEKC